MLARVLDKHKGCVAKIIDVSFTGQIEVHRELPLEQIVLGQEIDDKVNFGQYNGNVVLVKFATEDNKPQFRKELALLRH